MSLMRTAWDLLTWRNPDIVPTLPQEQRSIATMIGPYQSGRPLYPDRTIQTYDEKGYRSLGLIFAAATMTAESVASATLRVYDEARDKQEVENHGLRRLMMRPNQEMEESRWLSMMTMIASIAGFSIAEKERSASGRTVALWPLRSDWCTAILRDQAPPDWEYKIPGRDKVLLKAEDVIVFTYADRPDRSPYGIGPLEVCLREVGLLNRMTDFVKTYFDNGAVPFYGLVPDLPPGRTMSQEDIDKVLDGWVRRHNGMDRAMRPAFLQAIKDVKRLSLDMNELAYTDLRDLSDLAIAQAFRIPASMLQIRVGLEHSDSRANAEVDQYKFYQQTIQPLWRRLDGVLSINLLPEFATSPTQTLEFDTSNISALQENRNERAGWLVDGAARGVFSVHTVHRELGLPVPDGDDFYLRGLVTEAVPVTDPLGEDVAPDVPPESLPATTSDRSIRMSPDDLKELRALPRRSLEYRAQSGVVQRKQIAAVADKTEPSLRTFFAKQARRIVPLITAQLPDNRSAEVRATDDDALQAINAVNWTAEQRQLASIVDRIHLLAGSTAWSDAQGLYDLGIDGTFSLKNPKVKDVAGRLGKRIVGMNDETKSMIAETVVRGVNAGKTLDDIAKDLEAVVDRPSRARTIARTESMVAYGEANALAFKEAGIERAQIFDNPEHTDSYGASDGLTCAERNGIIVDIDKMMDHIYADHPNGSAVGTPIVEGDVE